MANRHERRRNAKHSMSTMTVSEFLELPSMCAWHGCGKVAKNPYAAGWHSMLLYKGQPKLNFIEIEERNVQRDAVLCPEHARHLDERLLIDIGGRLRDVQGTA
ncbi:hypothetical protein [Ensifer sp. OV372]|uniref:hypothetical protein n=1 Tax=Ensifer sp. OV372 TaxID=1855293 RepID=UPI0008E0CE9A|nr:hypothetical protein [Ensifer sp. OV372]SFH22918.1 hypothetical protein SAMN05216459_1215 [Ensifer sp. OV372]